MHVAETEEQAYADVEFGLADWVDYFQRVAALPLAPETDDSTRAGRRHERVGLRRHRHARRRRRPDRAARRPVGRVRHLPLHGPRVGRPGGDATGRTSCSPARCSPTSRTRPAPPTESRDWAVENRPEFIGAAGAAIMTAIQKHHEEKAGRPSRRVRRPRPTSLPVAVTRRAGELPNVAGAPKEQLPPGISQAPGPHEQATLESRCVRAPHRRCKPLRGEALRSHDSGGGRIRRATRGDPHDRPDGHDLKPTAERLPATPSPTATSAPTRDEQAEMLAALGYDSLDELVDRRRARRHPARRAARPARPPRREAEALAELRALAGRNRVVTSMIGLGYHGTITPAGHPAQRAREPGLVHGLHAVPARDLPGPARGARSTSRRWSPT